MSRVRGAIASLLMLAALSVPASALATPPNDDWANRTSVSTLPFSDTQTGVETANEATTDAFFPCRVAGADSRPIDSVFYAYTTGAVAEYVNLSTATSNYDTLIAVLKGAPGAFTAIHRASLSGLRLEANTTYTIEVAAENAAHDPATLHFGMSFAPLKKLKRGTDTVQLSATGATTVSKKLKLGA